MNLDALEQAAQAIDGRVAALMDGIVAMATQIGLVTAGQPLPERYLAAYNDLRRLIASDLATLAAERDERLRREGWDAALTAVRRETGALVRDDGDILVRLASEGPPHE